MILLTILLRRLHTRSTYASIWRELHSHGAELIDIRYEPSEPQPLALTFEVDERITNVPSLKSRLDELRLAYSIER